MKSRNTRKNTCRNSQRWKSRIHSPCSLRIFLLDRMTDKGSRQASQESCPSSAPSYEVGGHEWWKNTCGRQVLTPLLTYSSIYLAYKHWALFGARHYTKYSKDSCCPFENSMDMINRIRSNQIISKGNLSWLLHCLSHLWFQFPETMSAAEITNSQKPLISCYWSSPMPAF